MMTRKSNFLVLALLLLITFTAHARSHAGQVTFHSLSSEVLRSNPNVSRLRNALDKTRTKSKLLPRADIDTSISQRPISTTVLPENQRSVRLHRIESGDLSGLYYVRGTVNGARYAFLPDLTSFDTWYHGIPPSKSESNAVAKLKYTERIVEGFVTTSDVAFGPALRRPVQCVVVPDILLLKSSGMSLGVLGLSRAISIDNFRARSFLDSSRWPNLYSTLDTSPSEGLVDFHISIARRWILFGELEDAPEAQTLMVPVLAKFDNHWQFKLIGVLAQDKDAVRSGRVKQHLEATLDRKRLQAVFVSDTGTPAILSTSSNFMRLRGIAFLGMIQYIKKKNMHFGLRSEMIEGLKLERLWVQCDHIYTVEFVFEDSPRPSDLMHSLYLPSDEDKTGARVKGGSTEYCETFYVSAEVTLSRHKRRVMGAFVVDPDAGLTGIHRMSAKKPYLLGIPFLSKLDVVSFRYVSKGMATLRDFKGQPLYGTVAYIQFRLAPGRGFFSHGRAVEIVHHAVNNPQQVSYKRPRTDVEDASTAADSLGRRPSKRLRTDAEHERGPAQDVIVDAEPLDQEDTGKATTLGLEFVLPPAPEGFLGPETSAALRPRTSIDDLLGEDLEQGVNRDVIGVTGHAALTVASPAPGLGVSFGDIGKPAEPGKIASWDALAASDLGDLGSSNTPATPGLGNMGGSGGAIPPGPGHAGDLNSIAPPDFGDPGDFASTFSRILGGSDTLAIPEASFADDLGSATSTNLGDVGGSYAPAPSNFDDAQPDFGNRGDFGSTVFRGLGGSITPAFPEASLTGDLGSAPSVNLGDVGGSYATAPANFDDALPDFGDLGDFDTTFLDGLGGLDTVRPNLGISRTGLMPQSGLSGDLAEFDPEIFAPLLQLAKQGGQVGTSGPNAVEANMQPGQMFGSARGSYNAPGVGASVNLPETSGNQPGASMNPPQAPIADMIGGSLGNQPGASINQHGVSVNRPQASIAHMRGSSLGNRPGAFMNQPGASLNQPGASLYQPRVPAANMMGGASVNPPGTSRNQPGASANLPRAPMANMMRGPPANIPGTHSNQPGASLNQPQEPVAHIRGSSLGSRPGPSMNQLGASMNRPQAPASNMMGDASGNWPGSSINRPAAPVANMMGGTSGNQPSYGAFGAAAGNDNAHGQSGGVDQAWQGVWQAQGEVPRTYQPAHGSSGRQPTDRNVGDDRWDAQRRGGGVTGRKLDGQKDKKPRVSNVTRQGMTPHSRSRRAGTAGRPGGRNARS